MKQIIAFLLTFLSATAFAAESIPGEFIIKGKLENIPDGTLIYVSQLKNNMFKIICSDTLRNGQFMLRDTVSDTSLLYLSANIRKAPGHSAKIWVAPGAKIKITGKDLNFPLWKVISNIPEQEFERKKIEVQMPELAEILRLSAEESELMAHLYVDLNGREDSAATIWKKIEDLRKTAAPYDDRQETKTLEFLASAPVDNAWLQEYYVFTWRLGKPQAKRTEEIRALYSKIPDNMKQTPIGRAITEYISIEEPINVGDYMADGDLYDIDGKKHRLSELKGRYIMLDFWNVACGPCRQSIPEIKEVEEIYKDRMYLVSISSDVKEEWLEALKKLDLHGLQWNELRAGNTGLAARYRLTGFPHYTLIDPEGKVIDIWSGYGKGSIKERLAKNIK